jgi:hypothetical protein
MGENWVPIIRTPEEVASKKKADVIKAALNHQIQDGL